MNNIKSVAEKIQEIRRRNVLGEFSIFCDQYFKTTDALKEASFHKELKRIFQSVLESRGQSVAIAAPRGSAKTTVMSWFVIYCLCKESDPYILLVSGTKKQSEGLLEEIKHILETNEKLMKDFPRVCDVCEPPKPKSWNRGEIITKNNIKVQALGSGQQFRGIKHQGKRPTLIVVDDIEIDKKDFSPQEADNVYAWLLRTVFNCGTYDTNTIMLGTLHHHHSVIGRFLKNKEHSGWTRKVYRAIEKWAENVPMWDQWKRIYLDQEDYEGESGSLAARTYFRQNKKTMLKGVKVLWPSKYNYYDLMVKQIEDGPAVFNAEMQCDPVNPTDLFFAQTELLFWDDEYKTWHDLFHESGHTFRMYGACDPSLGKNKMRGDFTAIITIAVNEKGRAYVIDVFMERITPHETAKKIVELHGQYKYKEFAIESNQYQNMLVEEVKHKVRAAQKSLKIIAVNNTASKHERIHALSVPIENGDVLFSRKHHALIEQLRQFPKGRYDDAVDAFQMAMEMKRTVKGDINALIAGLQQIGGMSEFDYLAEQERLSTERHRAERREKEEARKKAKELRHEELRKQQEKERGEDETK